MKPNLASITNAPSAELGQIAWQDALTGADRELFLRMTQASAVCGLGDDMRQSPEAQLDVLYREPWRPALRTMDFRGVDLGSVLQIWETSDGTTTLRGSLYTLRPTHTMDGSTVWLDEAADAQVLDTSSSPLLPDPSIVADPVAAPAWWILDTGDEAEVVAIESGESLLLAGSTFVQRDTRLFFNRHPGDLLTSQVLKLVLEDRPDARAYTAMTAGPEAEQALALKRNNPTTARLQALIETMSRTYTSTVAGVIQSSMPLAEGRRYILEDVECVVPVAHAALAVGTSIQVGQQFGSVVQLLEPSGTDSWWMGLDWSNGLSLDGLTPITGLTVPAGTVKVTAADVGDDTFVTLALQGDRNLVTRFNYWLRYACSLQSDPSALADELGLTNGQTAHVELIGLLFKLLWGRRALVLRTDLPDPSRVVRVLKENMSPHSVLVVYNIQ